MLKIIIILAVILAVLSNCGYELPKMGYTSVDKYNKSVALDERI
jgi:hypothetical protein